MKKQKTPEQIAEHESQKAYNKKVRCLVTLIKKNCREKSLRIMELQMEFIKQHPTTVLPSDLDWKETVECFEAGISQFKQELELNRIRKSPAK